VLAGQRLQRDGACVGTSFPAPDLPRPLLPQNGALTGSPSAPAGFTRCADLPLDGFAVGRLPDAAYDLQLDDSCATPGFETCAFPSPEVDVTAIVGITYVPPADLPVSTTAPVGRRYYWRLRACRGTDCSAWTAVRYLDVGPRAQDFNGDGYSDVVVGAPSASSGGSLLAGAAFVYAGSSTGIAPAAPARLDPPAPQTGALFGWSVAWAGDLNADGFADLAVGAPSQDAPEADEGNAFVFLGSAAGLPAAPAATLDSRGTDRVRTSGGAWRPRATWTATDSATCSSVRRARRRVGRRRRRVPVLRHDRRRGPRPGRGAGGRRARSGRRVRLVGGDGGRPERRRVRRLRGGRAAGRFHRGGRGTGLGVPRVGVGSADGGGVAPRRPGRQAGAHFGWSVATAGDINVNGNSELLVGAPGQSNFAAGEGNIFVYYGSAAGVPTTPSGLFDNRSTRLGRRRASRGAWAT